MQKNYATIVIVMTPHVVRGTQAAGTHADDAGGEERDGAVKSSARLAGLDCERKVGGGGIPGRRIETRGTPVRGEPAPGGADAN